MTHYINYTHDDWAAAVDDGGREREQATETRDTRRVRTITAQFHAAEDKLRSRGHDDAADDVGDAGNYTIAGKLDLARVHLESALAAVDHGRRLGDGTVDWVARRAVVELVGDVQ